MRDDSWTDPAGNGKRPRKLGFYWCGMGDGAFVALWSGSYWTTSGSLVRYMDDDFDWIDEAPLARNREQGDA